MYWPTSSIHQGWFIRFTSSHTTTLIYCAIWNLPCPCFSAWRTQCPHNSFPCLLVFKQPQLWPREWTKWVSVHLQTCYKDWGVLLPLCGAAGAYVWALRPGGKARSKSPLSNRCWTFLSRLSQCWWFLLASWWTLQVAQFQQLTGEQEAWGRTK